MDDQDRALLPLATRVADGTPVDWDFATASDPDLKGGIKGLRWIEAVAISSRLAGRMLSDQVEPEQASDEQQDRPTSPSPAQKLSILPKEADAETATAPTGRGPISPLRPGSSWGALRIVEKIGEGGGGEVFRAHDPTLGRDVALKLWKENAVYRTSGTEARRLATVRHPGILSVHGTGRFDGYAGMWTDLVLGKNLEEILEEDGVFDVAEVCRIGIALCEALRAMHRKGLVHRDVKTTNVMREGRGRIVLMDFGSVKELPRGVPEHTERKRGTPLAMAPEVLRGERIGPSADIYGVGVLLYRLVSGRYPIEAKTMPELVDLHGQSASVPLHECRPDLPPGFVGVVQGCLAPRPSGRPKDVETLRQELVRLAKQQRGHGSRGATSGFWAKLTRWAR